MNYYEELGVSRSAGNLQIQQAYKALVRILHPDQQQDENLRRLSELQLRRLNHIAHVLTDPIQRREYDQTLDNYLPVPVNVPRAVSLSDISSVRLRLTKPTAGTLVWALIVLIAGGSLVLWFREPNPAPSPTHAAVTDAEAPPTFTVPRAQPVPPKAETIIVSTPPVEPDPLPETPAERSRFIQPAHPQVREQPVSRASLRPPTSVFRADAAPAWATKNENKADSVRANAALALLAAEPQKTREQVDSATPQIKATASSLAGKWLYAAHPDELNKGLYPPQYIEMQIHHKGGALYGKYYAKYKITDRAITPEVIFQFEGKANDSGSVLPWSSSSGAKGELRLKRLSEESLEVTWITTAFGRGDTLASGKAVLYKSE